MLVTILVGSAAPALAGSAGPEGAAASGSPSSGGQVARVNLRLEGRAAGRLFADAKEADGVADEDKSKAGEGGAEKSDEIKMTVLKGDAAKKKQQPAGGKDDMFAFVKDWPFWAIVGGVVIVGASVYMINRNNNQSHSCSGVYDAGCFGAK